MLRVQAVPFTPPIDSGGCAVAVQSALDKIDKAGGVVKWIVPFQTIPNVATQNSLSGVLIIHT